MTMDDARRLRCDVPGCEYMLGHLGRHCPGPYPRDDELAKLRERCEFAERQLRALDPIIDKLDSLGQERAKREGKPYDRYTCWAEPAVHLLEDLAASQAREKEARAKAIEECLVVAKAWYGRVEGLSELIADYRALATTSPGEEKTQPAKEAERCVDCGGEGHRAYPDTTLGRGGIGGQMISSGVCRACNGTGAAKKEGER